MMKLISNPPKQDWSRYIQRPLVEKATINESVSAILKEVKQNGDKALIEYTASFDRVEIKQLEVDKEEIQTAIQLVPDELKKAIQLAAANIETFHRSQLMPEEKVETTAGVVCWRKNKAITRVGLYIPGGTAPLFSTILMLGIPAQIAGCREIVLCTPPDQKGKINPAILYTAHLIGIQQIFKVGGAQAIAAMAYGTATIPKVYKIFGPGNQFVTRAKEMVQEEGVAIDMPAGPSEVLVVADRTCVPEFVAADLLSQAEHGTDSQVILLSDSDEVIGAVQEKLNQQLAGLPRKVIASEALKNSCSIVFETLEECMQFSNCYAPEHLIIATENAETYAGMVENAGSVFLGNYSCESAGDYASGTNHTLPTNGFAKNYSGVSVDSFVKKITFQSITREGIQGIGPAIEVMADAEGLFAHKNAVTLRLKK